MRVPVARARGGFTMIELLAVLLILSILVVLFLTQYGDATRSVERSNTETVLKTLQAAVEHYATENGGPPPSSFLAAQEVANDGVNVGGEALVAALWSKKYEAGGLLDDVRERLVNTDGDHSAKQITDFGNRQLMEIPDAWGNPIAYIEHADYPLTNRRYQTSGPDGQTIESVPLAFKNPRTGQYYSPQGFQLISAGLDGEFGTEDDLTPFQRE